jgi:hypothetical protein
VIYSGPKYESMQIEKNKIILSFQSLEVQFKGKGTHTNFILQLMTRNSVWAEPK